MRHSWTKPRRVPIAMTEGIIQSHKPQLLSQIRLYVFFIVFDRIETLYDFQPRPHKFRVLIAQVITGLKQFIFTDVGVFFFLRNVEERLLTISSCGILFGAFLITAENPFPKSDFRRSCRL